MLPSSVPLLQIEEEEKEEEEALCVSVCVFVLQALLTEL
jgi:hypothetical protein